MARQPPWTLSLNLNLLLIILITVIVFHNTLYGGFLDWDDHWLIDQPTIKSPLTLRNLTDIFTFGNNPHYSPVRDLSYKLDYLLYKDNPFGFHLTNLLIYLISVILVYKIFFLLLADLASKEAILFWTLVFTVHPIHSETVAWLAERKGLLAGLFIFSSFYYFILYINKDKRLFYLFSLLLFFLGTLSKPSVLAFPLAFFLYLLLFNKRSLSKKEVFFKTFPYLFLIIPSFFLNFFYFKDTTLRGYKGAYYYQMGQALWQYLFNFFSPVRLAPIYTFKKELIPFLISILSLFIFFVCLGFIIRQVKTEKNRKIIFLSIGWIIFSFLPTANIIPNNILCADRFFYLPSFGSILLLGIIWEEMKKRYLVTRRYLYKIFAVVTIIILSVAAHGQNYIWQDDFKLWTHAVKSQPKSSYSEFSLGLVQAKQGNYDDALRHYFRAIELDPEYARAYTTIGLTFYELKDYKRAVQFYSKALGYDPNDVEVYNGLIVAYGRQGMYAQALDIYYKAKEKGLSSGSIEKNYWLLQKKIRGK
ncbi:MAG: tetratricopeptide repeat protein [bacterium]